MLLIVALIAVFILWSWWTWPRIGQLLYDLSMALEARLYRLHKVPVAIAEMTLMTYQGGPPKASATLLMLHGYSADKTLWLRFARHFVADYGVIIPDLPGHGETGFRPRGSYDIPSQAQRLIQLLDARAIEKVRRTLCAQA
jgi:pimeloyl-ACP methyl ester carboxylesterase